MTIKNSFLQFVEDRISDIKVVLEIGSRDGYQAIEFSKTYPEAKIYSFEANPVQVEVCRKNTKDYPNIEIIPYAVFNKNERMKFYPCTENVGASSMFKFEENYAKGFHLSQIEIEVHAVRIDTWACLKGIEKIDLIWIDLQGAEYEAYQGMGDLLKEVQAIYTEVCYESLYKKQKLFPDLKELLNKKGFSLIRNTPVRRAWGNAIFINN